MFTLIVIILTVSFLTIQAHSCPEQLITLNNRTLLIKDEEVRELQPSFGKLQLQNYTVEAFSNGTSLQSLSRESFVSTTLFRGINPVSNASIYVIAKPTIPVDPTVHQDGGQLDCVQVPCPGTFNEDTVCWKCIQQELTTSSQDADSDGDGVILSRTNAISLRAPEYVSRASFIHYGDYNFTCPDSTLVVADTTGPTGTIITITAPPQSSDSSDKYCLDRSWFFICLIGGLIASCCICFVLSCVCRRRD